VNREKSQVAIIITLFNTRCVLIGKIFLFTDSYLAIKLTYSRITYFSAKSLLLCKLHIIYSIFLFSCKPCNTR